jgi:hypothetical protein
LVFPSVAFRPVRLFVLSIAITAVALVAAGLSGHLMVGVFFGVGLLLGLLNAVLVSRSVASITAKEHPMKSSMALNSATRLALITVIGRLHFPARRTGRGVRIGAFPGAVGGGDSASGMEEAAHRRLGVRCSGRFRGRRYRGIGRNGRKEHQQ